MEREPINERLLNSLVPQIFKHVREGREKSACYEAILLIKLYNNIRSIKASFLALLELAKKGYMEQIKVRVGKKQYVIKIPMPLGFTSFEFCQKHLPAYSKRVKDAVSVYRKRLFLAAG